MIKLRVGINMIFLYPTPFSRTLSLSFFSSWYLTSLFCVWTNKTEKAADAE